MKQFVLRRFEEIRASCATLPDRAVWRRCIRYYLVFAVCAGGIGIGSGLLRFEPIRSTPIAVILLAIYLLFSPAIVEEIVFRAALLPRNRDGLSRGALLVICTAALCLFVTSHAINGLYFRHVAVFLNPWFLLMAALLGATCIAIYLTSRSIWPGVVAHWLTVLIWIALLGGERLLERG
ncbi:MAG TPA: CPBP family glutamic-type intramembrane protease [Armatimonadota bacterium]|nr:CPBP family glutamic-type intramembrane protease [Armatimonadota bacterium]